VTRGIAPLLMTPGPTRVPDRVLRAGNRLLHHRTPEFSAALAECIALLRPVFGAREANFFKSGETVIACCNGKFGEIWANLAEVHGLDVVRIATDWNQNVDPGEVETALAAHPAARAVTIVHSDTSTGVLNPVEDVARVARAHGALSLVDGISSLGGLPSDFDAWDLDFAVTSSQKCLMSSPGISFAVVGDRAWAAAEHGGMPRSYLDFPSIRKSLAGDHPETPGTTPVLLVLQVREALRMMHEEGLTAVFERHVAMAEQLRTRVAGMGFDLQGPGMTERSPTLTALHVPDGVDPHALRTAVRERGIEIAVGLGAYRDTCVRVGHMGDIRLADVNHTVDVIESALPAVQVG